MIPRRRTRARLLVLVTALAVTAAACTGPTGRRSDGPRTGPGRTHTSEPTGPVDSPPAVTTGPLLLATSFERPICGKYQHPGPGCEFGYEGDDLETGSFDCRTGPSCLRIGRVSHSHMGVIREVPLPGGHAFIGVSNRIPSIPDGAIPEDPGYLELLQLSPTDGLPGDPGYPAEVRLYPDRRLGLGLYRGNDVAISRRSVPVDEWFSLVVELTNGVGATQRMWIYDADGPLVDSVHIALDTRQTWPHSDRTAQKLGGAASSLEPFNTFHDDWWIAETFLGPIAIDPAGRPI